jgi:hypothetical protein
MRLPPSDYCCYGPIPRIVSRFASPARKSSVIAAAHTGKSLYNDPIWGNHHPRRTLQARHGYQKCLRYLLQIAFTTMISTSARTAPKIPHLQSYHYFEQFSFTSSVTLVAKRVTSVGSASLIHFHLLLKTVNLGAQPPDLVFQQQAWLPMLVIVGPSINNPP